MPDKNKSQNQSFGDFSDISLPSSNSAPTNNDQPILDTPLPDAQQPENSSPNSPVTTEVRSSDLASIKEKALQQLSPIVNHLDQPPEEKFRTTMMMIQAADDQTLIPKAYEAAQAITDDKEKARALLDVINEINYFSQKEQS